MRASASPPVSKLLFALAALLSLLLIPSVTVSQSSLQVGYAVMTADAGSRLPVGSGLFTYTNSAGVLVSQAGVGAAEPALNARVFVDEAGTRTGVALVNSAAVAASVALILRDASGQEVARQSLTIGGNQHLSRYVREWFGSVSEGFTGTLTIQSNQPLAAVTLRESRNAYNEPLYATLPVVNLDGADAAVRVFPHIAAGDGYLTQLILMNGTAAVVSGQIRLYSADGRPLVLRLNGNGVSEFPYQISGNGSLRFQLDSVAGLSVGYAILTSATGSAPAGTAVFQYRRNGFRVTEAGVVAASTTIARSYVDYAGTQTGIAVANPSSQPVAVTFTLLDRFGNTENTAARTLAAQGNLAIFVHELFPSVGEGFTGLIEIRSATPVYGLTLKLTINSRDDLILTTLPLADLTRISSLTATIFPHIAIGEGFSTRLITLNPSTSSASTGLLRFAGSDGSSLIVLMEGRSSNQFSYRLLTGAGRQFLPGDAQRLANILVTDNEVGVNEGGTARIRLRGVDSAGRSRDDFDPLYSSADSGVATVDAAGNVQGRLAGFSTVTVTAGGVVTTSTITVTRVTTGTAAFEVDGIVQDLARRLYVASRTDHTILLTQDFLQAPALYAGTVRSPGLKNDVRLQSQFRNPAFLALNQADGSLYVSDSANNVIRRVRPGTSGRVETLSDAQFNNPQGIALDDRGYLWVADSGNQTIRRINVTTGQVETIAGTAGAAGSADGTGAAARFSAPAGIAVEFENTLAQLVRERRGDPAPPVHVIVADTGNGRLRRVYENGLVETIQIATASGLAASGSKQGASVVAAALPVVFDQPTQLSVDSTENIYVTEAGRGRVRVMLRQGSVVTLGGEGTFRQPTGIVTNDIGKVIVGDSGRALQEVTYGAPRITSVSPSLISARGGVAVTVNGSNFAPETFVIVGTTAVNAKVETTQRLTFTAPAGLLSGITILTVQNRGGIGQTSLRVEPVPLSSLSAGEITTIAGGTTFAGEGAQGRTISLAAPKGVVLDTDGNLYVSDYENHRVRRIDARTGIATTVAGNGRLESSGDNGPAVAAGIGWPQGLAIDKGGNLLIADLLGRIRKVDLRAGIITTVAGIGYVNFSGDNGPATSASIGSSTGIALDRSGNLFITDSYNNRVRRVDAVSGIITTVAGNGTRGSSGDGGRAVDAALWPWGIAVDRDGNLYIGDQGNGAIRRVDASGRITTYAASGRGVAVDAEGNILISDSFNIRRVDGQTGVATTVAGNGRSGSTGDGGPATAASLAFPIDFVADGSGNIWISDSATGRIREVNARTGLINSVAGSGTGIPLGDGDRAVFAKLYFPGQMTFTRDGSLYIADSWNNRVRKVDARTGIISTVAGADASQRFGLVFGVATDSGENLYISDYNASVIRKLSSNGTLSVFAGTLSVGGFSGDGGPAASAKLAQPQDLAVDGSGNLFISDTFNNRIRRVDARTSVITTFAGTGTSASAGDGGPASRASFERIYGMTMDSLGNIFVSDNNRVRRIDAVTSVITTAADLSTGVSLSAFGGLATIASDRNGNIFFSTPSTVGKIDGRGAVRIVAGQVTRKGLSGDGGPATSALVNVPQGLAVDVSGNLYIADTFNDTIRVIKGPIP